MQGNRFSDGTAVEWTRVAGGTGRVRLQARRARLGALRMTVVARLGGGGNEIGRAHV